MVWALKDRKELRVLKYIWFCYIKNPHKKPIHKK